MDQVTAVADTPPGVLRRTPNALTLRALDYLNIFLADVRDGVGPYLAIYLLATQQWDPASIGIAMSAMGIATVVAQTPCGALIDALTQKRALIAVAALLVGVSCVAVPPFPTFTFIMTAQALNGIAAAIFPPAEAAVTLGIVGPKHFAARMGRNEAFNHAGNVGAAAIAGASIVSVFFIEEKDLDHDQARAAGPCHARQRYEGSGITALFACRELLIFTLAVTLFHFANAAMLPLAGQLLSQDKADGASLYMSACIIAAQLVMIPVAAFAGATQTAGDASRSS